MKNKKLLLGIGIGALVLILAGGLVANNSGLFQGKIRNTSPKVQVAPTSTDYDKDGLTNQQEANIGTDPLKKDTDGDGYNDKWEIRRGCDPLIFTSSMLDCSSDADADGDLLSRWVESWMDTDLANPDTDGDGYSDGMEVGEAYQVSWGDTPSFIDPELVSDPLDPCDPSTASPACVQ